MPPKSGDVFPAPPGSRGLAGSVSQAEGVEGAAAESTRGAAEDSLTTVGSLCRDSALGRRAEPSGKSSSENGRSQMTCLEQQPGARATVRPYRRSRSGL